MSRATSASPRAALAALTLIGVVLLAFVAAGPWIVRVFGYGVFIPAAAVSGLLALGATQLSRQVAQGSALVIVLGLALAMRLLLIGEPPLLSTDLYRYIWDGRVQAAGINPYLFVPADAALAALRDSAIFPNINRADYAVTAYPPVAEMVFLLATRIAETPAAMRLAMVGFEIIIIVAMIDLLRRLALPPAAVVAYAWHPLAIWEISNNGHVEATMVALLLAGVALLTRGGRTAGAVAVTLAALVKPYAVIALPAFWRPWDWRVPAAVGATILICYAPYLGAGAAVLGFLGGGYVAEEGLWSGSGIWLVALLQSLTGPIATSAPAYLVMAAAVMLVLGLYCGFDPRRGPRETVQAVILLVTTGLVLLSPNYAWYFLALVPFIPLGAGAAGWALTLGAFLLYRPVYLGPGNDLIWKSLATLPFLLVLAGRLGRRGLRRQGLGHAA